MFLKSKGRPFTYCSHVRSAFRDFRINLYLKEKADFLSVLFVRLTSFLEPSSSKSKPLFLLRNSFIPKVGRDQPLVDLNCLLDCFRSVNLHRSMGGLQTKGGCRILVIYGFQGFVTSVILALINEGIIRNSK